LKSKTCRVCGESHDLSFYHRDSRAKDGHRNECKNCSKKKGREYYLANREKYKAETKRRYRENRQAAIEYARQWRQKNPEKVKEYHERYRERYPEKERLRHIDKQLRRNALKKNNGVFKVRAKDLSKIYSMPCTCCGSRGKIHVDHVIPIAKGGVHGVGNLQPLCESCNTSKADKYMIEWKKYKQDYASS